MGVLSGQDSVDASGMTPGHDVYCGYDAGAPGYAGGSYSNMASVRAAFPGKKYVSVGTSAIDEEPGLASPGDAVGFVQGWKPDGNVVKPMVYGTASWLSQSVADLSAAGIARDRYFLWLAAWDDDPSIPAGYDAKQYANTSGYDADSFYDYIFSGSPVPPPSQWPLVQGSSGPLVVTLQQNLNKWRSAMGNKFVALQPDGNFGPATAGAVTVAEVFLNVHGVPAGTCTQAMYTQLAKSPSPVPPPPPPSGWTYDPVRNLTLLQVAGTEAAITWTEPAGPLGAPPVGIYEIAASAGTKLGEQIPTYPRYRAPNAISRVALTGLPANTELVVAVRAQSSDPADRHSSGWSEVIVPKGGNPAPPPVPGPSPQPSGSFPLKQGDTGQLVINLQNGLNAWLGSGLTVDGNFGPLTAAAVTAAQQHFNQHNVTPGEADEALYLKLQTTPPVPPKPPAGKYPDASQAVAGTNQQINGEIIYGYLRQHGGYNEMQACGAIASMWGESVWDPESAGTGGNGLIGDTPPIPGNVTGNPQRDMAVQLPHILNFVAVNGDQGAVNQMATASTVTEAATLWMRYVERAGISDVHSAGVAAAAAIAFKLDGVNLPQ